MDVASWNIGGRVVNQNEAGNERSFEVDGWPLITYHFSGTGPSGTHRWVREIFAPSSGAMAEIERHYEEVLARLGQKQLETVPPISDYFDNGERVPAEARKIYRIRTDLQAAFPDPYAVGPRSEEHTSELPSLLRNSYAVFCLKKTQHKQT